MIDTIPGSYAHQSLHIPMSFAGQLPWGFVTLLPDDVLVGLALRFSGGESDGSPGLLLLDCHACPHVPGTAAAGLQGVQIASQMQLPVQFVGVPPASIFGDVSFYQAIYDVPLLFRVTSSTRHIFIRMQSTSGHALVGTVSLLIRRAGWNC